MRTPWTDLFESEVSHQLPMYIAWKQDRESVVTNAFSITWNKGLYSAFPPFYLITEILNKLVKDTIERLILIPSWKTAVIFFFRAKFTHLQKNKTLSLVACMVSVVVSQRN